MDQILAIIREVLDYGGVLLLSCLILYFVVKKLDSIESKLTKTLTLLTVVVKETTSFNHVHKVLDKYDDDVKQTLKDSGALD